MNIKLHLIWMALLLIAAPLRADDMEVAKTLFLEGTKLLKEGNYKAAIAQFEASIKLDPSKKSPHINLGTCYKKENRPVEAVREFEYVIHTFESSLSDIQKKVTNDSLNELNSLVGRLPVHVDQHQQGATITVDGTDEGISPLSHPLVLAPGKRVVEVSLEGYQPKRVEVEILAGIKSEPLEVKLLAVETPDDLTKDEKDASSGARSSDTTADDDGSFEKKMPKIEPDHITQDAPPLEASETVPEKKGRGMLVGGLVSSALGVAGLVVGGVFTRRGYDHRDELKDASVGPREDYDTLYEDELPKDQAATLAGFIAGGTLLATGTILILIDRLRNKKGRGETERATVMVRPQGGAIGVSF